MKVAAVILIAGMAASGCARAVPAAGPTPPAGPSTSPIPNLSSSPTPQPSTVLAPLRGTVVPAGSLNHASIAAKIDNQFDARPQIGLESTDLVFEELVEGGLTRYMAVWQSTIPALIGPVRSIRPMDPFIVSPFGGIICYSGGQPRFVDLMRQAPVYNAIHGQPDTASTFYRTTAKVAPHNVLVKAQELLAQHMTIAPPAQQFTYSTAVATSTAVTAGAPEQKLDLAFSSASRPSWVYDPAQQAFLRSQNGVVDLDSSKTQLKTTNVVILRVPISYGFGIPKTELIGSGEAWVATGGFATRVTWSKVSQTDPIHLKDAAGASVHLAPGNTWIEMVPTDGSVSFVAPPAG